MVHVFVTMIRASRNIYSESQNVPVENCGQDLLFCSFPVPVHWTPCAPEVPMIVLPRGTRAIYVIEKLQQNHALGIEIMVGRPECAHVCLVCGSGPEAYSLDLFQNFPGAQASGSR